jgi:hypothetical protein
MERRDFCKSLAAVPASGALASVTGLTDSAIAGKPAQTGKVGGKPTSGASGSREVPEYAKDFLTSDMNGLGPDGKPTNMRATFTGASKANATAEEAMRHKMQLTKEEQAILDGKDGEEMAKLMKILVLFGNIFGAEKLVDLGGAPHSNLLPGAPYLGSLIKMLDECAKAGLKSYAPYTVNPRPYDCFNVQNNEKEMQIVYEGYPLQKDLD